jgi:hypothetical protein
MILCIIAVINNHFKIKIVTLIIEDEIIYETEIKSFLLLEMVKMVKIVLIWALLKIKMVKITL